MTGVQTCALPIWKELVEKCNLILFGSDQIWEKNIIGPKDKIYMGAFATNAAKVSYAASCYSEQSDLDDDLISNLQQFKRISVREEKIAEKLRKRLGQNHTVEVVADPVFLPDAEIYQKFSIKSEYGNTPYALFYMVAEDKELSKISEYLRKECGQKVIEIHYYKDRGKMEDWQRADVGPAEFIGLIKGAQYVFTNSFHGTAFSLILHKQFIVTNRNMRILNLLQTVGLEERAVLSLEDYIKLKNRNISYSSVKEKMNCMLENSRQFIDSALKDVSATWGSVNG